MLSPPFPKDFKKTLSEILTDDNDIGDMPRREGNGQSYERHEVGEGEGIMLSEKHEVAPESVIRDSLYQSLYFLSFNKIF